VAMAARGDLIGDVVHFQQRGMRFGFGDEGADALHANQKTFAGQLAQRAVDGHAADAQFRHQFTFGGHALVRLPMPRTDLIHDRLFDPLVDRGGGIAHCSRQL